MKWKRTKPPPDPWQPAPWLDLTISLFGPVANIQAALPDDDLENLFRGLGDVEPSVQAELDRPGFIASLRPTDGAIEALQILHSKNGLAHLVAPAGNRWRSCRADMYAWVERHLGAKWASSLILTNDRGMLRTQRLLTSYEERMDWHNADWDLVIFDEPHNRGMKGIRMLGWQDVDGLVGRWFDRIPWQPTSKGTEIWEIVDESHFGITVIRSGEDYRVHVFVEKFDDSTSFEATISRDYDLAHAASSPGHAGEILLDKIRDWAVIGGREPEYLGWIEHHERFEWGGRGW